MEMSIKIQKSFNSSMESTSIVGYAWRYLEIQGKLNATARKPAPRQTFYIESDEDDDSLLRFTKEIVPHKELIPPPQFANQKQLLRSQNPRLNSDPLAITAMRSSRQGADTEMTSNAFSNLDAIAKMGIDEHDTFSGQNTPVAGGGLSVEQGLISSNSCGQLAQGFEQQRVGGIGRLQMPIHRIGMPTTQQQQQMLHQMSPVEQQQRLNILYKQQQQKAQIPPATYRLMGTPQTGAEVFDFDEPSNFGNTIGSPSYNSPIGGGRRRGRGRRAGNMGDRQLSISSLESTPSSPSDYNPTGSGKRRAGIPGQRKPRKLKKQEEASNSFDQQQLPPYQQQFQPNMLTQQQSMMSDEFSTYNPAQTQEEVRSRLVSAYEIRNYESSSSDEEMDPPPPPRNLELKSAENEKKMEIQSGKAAAQKTSITQHKLSTTSMQKLLQEQQQQTSEIMLDVKQEIHQSNAPQSQQPIILKDIKLPYAASSSSSSPSTISTPQQQQSAQQSNLGDAIESRKNSKTKIDEIAKELEQLKQQPPTMDEKTNIKLKKNVPTFDDFFDNGIENTAIVKKEIFEPTKPKEANYATKSKNSANKEQSAKQKKQNAEESTKKPGKIVLKIPREGTAQMAAKNSSSSSPSSTSSSISASNFAQILSQMGDQPMARLSSSAAPPSKLKQQNAAQQKRPPKRPLDALEEGMKQKKSRKNEDSGKNSPTPRSTPSSTGQLKSSKSSKSKNNGQSTKEPAPAPSSHIALPPFPSLKNFKIPKVSEATETTTTQNSSATSLTMNRPGQSEHSSRSAEKEGRKSSTSSYSNVSPSNSSDYRRHGEKNNSNHSKGIWEKGTSGSAISSSSHSSNYNRQQQRSLKPDKRDRDQLDNSRSSKKYASHSNDRPGGRPPTSRPPSYQQPPPHSPRESGGIHQAFSSQNWPQFNQQYMPVYQQQVGGQQQQQKPNWMPQRLQTSQQMAGGFEQTQQQIYQPQYRQMPADEYQTLQQQQRPNSNQEEKTKSVEDRNDNSPSGDGLQIVDEE